LTDATSLEKIHALDNCKELPLILLSSSLPSLAPGDSTIEEFAVRLMKPIKQADLFNALTTALGNTMLLSEPLHRSKIFDATLATRLPLKILVAEDNVVNQKVAKGVLLQFGYQSDLVTNGKEALTAVQSNSVQPLSHRSSTPSNEPILLEGHASVIEPTLIVIVHLAVWLRRTDNLWNSIREKSEPALHFLHTPGGILIRSAPRCRHFRASGIELIQRANIEEQR
jgi:CheY-like chemotaxis protein